MDLLKSYDDGEISSDEDQQPQISVDNDKTMQLCIPKVNLTPQVVTVTSIPYKAVIDPKTKELMHNPKYEELYQPEVNFYLFIKLFLVRSKQYV